MKQNKQSPLGVLASVCVPPVQLSRTAKHINTDLAPPTPVVTEAQKRRNAETVEAHKRKGAEAQKRWKRRSAEAQKRRSGEAQKRRSAKAQKPRSQEAHKR